MTHSKLTEIASKWLKKHNQNIIIPNCNIIASELKTATSSGEIPDIIGWCSWSSVLIEVKVSRNDFLKDFKKSFRLKKELGVGDFRYYLCPENLIKKKDLPEDWGLLYINNENKIKIIQIAKKIKPNLKDERTILLSIIRRFNKSI